MKTTDLIFNLLFMYRKSDCRIISNDVVWQKSGNLCYIITYNVIRTEDWIFYVMHQNITSNVSHDMLSRICRNVGRHLKHTVNTFIYPFEWSRLLADSELEVADLAACCVGRSKPLLQAREVKHPHGSLVEDKRDKIKVVFS